MFKFESVMTRLWLEVITFPLYSLKFPMFIITFYFLLYSQLIWSKIASDNELLMQFNCCKLLKYVTIFCHKCWNIIFQKKFRHFSFFEVSPCWIWDFSPCKNKFTERNPYIKGYVPSDHNLLPLGSDFSAGNWTIKGQFLLI